VLGADVVVLEDAGFLLGQDDHLAGAFCEALKHDSFLASGPSEGGTPSPFLSSIGTFAKGDENP
jgi:hypothetical protein